MTFQVRQQKRTIAAGTLAVLLCASMAFAQDGTFTASADQTKVGIGEQFQVTFTIAGSEATSAKNFKAPDFGQLLVLSGPNQSSNIQIVNGKMSASLTYTYVLYARQKGRFTIGPAAIDYRGSQLKTQPIAIEVIQGKPAQKQETVDPGLANIGDNLFIRAVPDKQRARQGEQITITYKLYMRVSVTQYDLTKAPTYEGFWSEDIEQSRQPALVNETYEGKQFRVATIKKTAVFATQSGTLKIAPLEVRCAVQIQSRRRSNDPFDIFNDPFFQQTQTQQLDFKSNPMTLTIDPLPSNPPSGFTGAVGKYSFAAAIDKREVKAGDPITLKIAISGTGNVKLLTVPKPVLPSDMEAYEPKISEEISRDGGLIRGKKTAEYLLIPRNPGKRSIESIPFSYFDLENKSYVKQASSKFDISILPGKEITSGGALASKEDVRLLGEDIRFLKLSLGELRPVRESIFDNDKFYVAIVLPPLLFVGAVVYRRRMKSIYGDMPKFRFQQAGREAAKRLKQAKQLLAQGNSENYHAELSKALLGYLEDKLHLAKSTLTVEEASIRLQQRQVSEETINQLKTCIERAEFARFAPASDTTVVRKELLDAATSAINAIEKSFGGRS
jgi:hypothetical protein